MGLHPSQEDIFRNELEEFFATTRQAANSSVSLSVFLSTIESVNSTLNLYRDALNRQVEAYNLLHHQSQQTLLTVSHLLARIGQLDARLCLLESVAIDQVNDSLEHSMESPR